MNAARVARDTTLRAVKDNVAPAASRATANKWALPTQSSSRQPSRLESLGKWALPAHEDAPLSSSSMFGPQRKKASEPTNAFIPPARSWTVGPPTVQRSLSENADVSRSRDLPPHQSLPFASTSSTQRTDFRTPRWAMKPPPKLIKTYTPRPRGSVIDLKGLTPRTKAASVSVDEFVEDTAPDSALLPNAKERDRDRVQRKKSKGFVRLLDQLNELVADEPMEAPLRKPKPRKVKLLNHRVQKDIFIPSVISVANLSRLLNVRQGRLKREMYKMGMSDVSYDHLLSSDDASLIALELGRNPVVDDEAAFDLYPAPLSATEKSSLPLRPPVITIMGHVDHGKTTLLDTLRSTSVVSSEAGGITQHIGAFSVPVRSLSTSTSTSEVEGMPRTITFLDTPGHAAFTAMRARGAGVTDIIVLVVAADDGVMPQTKEVIELAKKDEMSEAGGVGMVVAINKCDKPGVDTTKVKQALLAAGVQLEEYGGDIPAVEVSGLTGLGLDKLVETISALAEVKELKARVKGSAEGYVLESRVDKGKGPVATVLVLQGTLTQSSTLICGTTWARVRQMTDSTGKSIQSATAGTPVTVCGWKDLPSAGDEVLSGEENDVKKAVENRKRKMELDELKVDVESINEKRKEVREREGEAEGGEGRKGDEESVKELRVIVKADVSGSVEAVVGAIEGIGNKIAKVKIVQTGVGDITDSDVDMAKAVDATIIGFSVKASNSVRQSATSRAISLHTETIIYRLMEEVKSRVTALLPPIIETRVLGEATIQEVFSIKLKGRQTLNVAGCRVTNGVVEKKRSIRVLRDAEVIYDGTVDTLKQVKKDINEARKGTDCGVSFEKFQDLKAGDVVQTYETIEKPATL